MLTLYSAWYCPFAQRALMALAHHGTKFDLIELDPYEKTPRWLAVSLGTGQVPVLASDNTDPAGFRLPGSMRVVEAVDHFSSNEKSSLYPANAQERANLVSWIDFADRQVIPYFYRYLKASPGSQDASTARASLEEGLRTLVEQMHPDGPFFTGPSLSAFDVAFVPFAARISLLLPHYRAYDLPTKGDVWKRYRVWREAVVQERSFQATFSDVLNYEDRLLEFYTVYASGGGQSDVAIVS